MAILKTAVSLSFFGSLCMACANAAMLQPGEWQMHVQMSGMPKVIQKEMSANHVPMCVHPGETAQRVFMYYTNDGCDFSENGAQGSGFSGNIVCYRGPHTFREKVRETVAANGKSFVAHIQLTHIPGNDPTTMKYMGASTYRGKWVGSVCTRARPVL